MVHSDNLHHLSQSLLVLIHFLSLWIGIKQLSTLKCCLPIYCLLLPPQQTVPCSIFFKCPEYLEMCPYLFNLSCSGQESFVDHSNLSLFPHCDTSFIQGIKRFLYHLIFMTCIIYYQAAVEVKVSLAYRKEIVRESIGLNLD